MRVPHYQYSVKTIWISLKAIFTSNAGFRCLASIFNIFQQAFVWDESPTHATIRQWLMKFGLFKLQKTHTGKEWALIVDSTIQMGLQKVLLILGVRVDKFKNNYAPSFQDAEPLVMKVIESCPGEVVKDAIQEAMEKVDNVINIVSDAGAEMKKGMKLLSGSGHNIPHVFDIVHLMSNLLKKELEIDDDWSQYKKQCNDMMQAVKLSDCGHLAPPRQRSKARLMASSTIIEWGQKLLAYVDTLNSNEIDPKLTWILKFRAQLSTWTKLLYLAKEALELVHKQGYHEAIYLEWNRTVLTLTNTNSRICKFVNSIKITLQTEADKIPAGQNYLGSSVIIESAFGKFKQLEGHHASSGITSLVLALPAMFGEIDEHELANALSSVSVNELRDWLDMNIGQTYLSKRKEALKSPCRDIDISEFFNHQIA